MTALFKKFNQGQLVIPGKTLSFENVPWNKHPTFAGVELKHIVCIRFNYNFTFYYYSPYLFLNQQIFFCMTFQIYIKIHLTLPHCHTPANPLSDNLRLWQ